MVVPANGLLMAAGAVVGAAAGATVGAAGLATAAVAAAVGAAAAGGVVGAGAWAAGAAGAGWQASSSGIAIRPPPSANSRRRRDTIPWSERADIAVPLSGA